MEKEVLTRIALYDPARGLLGDHLEWLVDQGRVKGTLHYCRQGEVAGAYREMEAEDAFTWMMRANMDEPKTPLPERIYRAEFIFGGKQ